MKVPQGSAPALFPKNLFLAKKEKKKKENIPRQEGGGGKTRSGTEKRCFHNLQSGHPAWRSADNCSIFSTVNDLDFLEARSAPAEEIRNA